MANHEGRGRANREGWVISWPEGSGQYGVGVGWVTICGRLALFWPVSSAIATVSCTGKSGLFGDSGD